MKAYYARKEANDILFDEIMKKVEEEKKLGKKWLKITDNEEIENCYDLELFELLTYDGYNVILDEEDNKFVIKISWANATIDGEGKIIDKLK